MFVSKINVGEGLVSTNPTVNQPMSSGVMQYDPTDRTVTITNVANGTYQNSKTAIREEYIDLSMETKAILGWAKYKMLKEKRLQEWLDKNPSYKEMFEQAKLIEILAGIHDD
jgi:hypothetical protein